MDTIPLLYQIGSLNDTTNLERPHSCLKALLNEQQNVSINDKENTEGANDRKNDS